MSEAGYRCPSSLTWKWAAIPGTQMFRMVAMNEAGYRCLSSPCLPECSLSFLPSSFFSKVPTCRAAQEGWLCALWMEYAGTTALQILHLCLSTDKCWVSLFGVQKTVVATGLSLVCLDCPACVISLGSPGKSHQKNRTPSQVG